VGSLLLSLFLSASTWALTRENLLNQREATATTVMYSNARSVRRQLSAAGDVDLTVVLQSLSTASGARPVLFRQDAGGAWEPAALTVEFDDQALPPALRTLVVEEGQPGRMRYEYRDQTHLAIGVPIPAIGAAYFEIVPLTDLEGTLRALTVSLTGASLVTTLSGAAFGWWASRRTLRPLSRVSAAALSLAGGRLETRLEGGEDPDLEPITASFNEMAQALQDRIERDARFASDVSHELRSPLMTLSASIAVLENQRDELPERARSALDLMSADIDRFQQLVEDLLEISRFDAGVVHLELEEVHLAELVMQAVSFSSGRDVPVEVDAELAGVVVEADKRRIVRVIANLLDNAAKYGDGATSVSLQRADGAVQIVVEDRGAGVPPEDRDLIFDRFSRGVGAGRRSGSDGVGLGLALVVEHVNLHGGSVWVEDRADGEQGARFVVELPVAHEDAR
jgi:two-component system, OmpR family, sensor histidine kinase MtrB